MAFIQRDGDLVDLDGISVVETCEIDRGKHFVALRHRNHLGAMTSTAKDLANLSLLLDFMDGSTHTWGTGALKELETGIWGLFGGDASMNGQAQNTDKENHWKPTVVQAGYKAADLNMNGQVQNTNTELIWKPNVGKGEQIAQ